MTGEREDRKRCPVCGGTLVAGEATIPYILEGDVVIIVKNMPAEICSDCRESFTSGKVTDQLVHMLQQLKSLHSEISVVPYPAYDLA